MATNANTALGTIVLVNGGYVDGSGWEDAYRILKKAGYRVSIVQNPTPTLADDVAATKRVIAEQTGHKGTAMLRRYIRQGSLFRENAASAVGL